MTRVIMAIIAIGILVAGIGLYLSPDDISDCPAPGSEATGICRKADAIVVISGGDTSGRTEEAIRLYDAGWAPKIIFSGAAADKTGPSNARVMREQAVAAGVPIEDTVAEEASETTKQNAREVRNELAILETKDIILVTSGYHMRRAGLEFVKEIGTEVTIRRHPVPSDNQWSMWWWLTPWGWWLAIGELVRITAFYVGGSR